MRARLLAVVCVTAVLFAGCGTRNQDAAQQSQDQTGTGQTTTDDTGGGGGGGGDESFGTMANPCGPNTSGTPNTATDTGVTEDEIVVTTISDPGGVRPGLNQGIFDSMIAFADWCNSFGGINGRTLTVMPRDAKIFYYLDKVTEACGDSFALVGGLGVTDDQGAQAAIDCGLVNVPGAAVSALQNEADRTYQPLPNPTNAYQTGAALWIKDQFPEAVKEAALIYSAVPSVKVQAERRVEAYTEQGFTFISNEAAAAGELNWGPLVLNLKNAGAKYFTATTSFEELVPLQKEMGAQGFEPEVTELETNFYNAKFPQLAKEQGAQIDNTYVRLTTWPFEEADDRPAMRSYLDILEAGVPGAQPEQLGVQSFSAGLLFATAAKAAGNDLTRDRLITELQNIHEWDAGGLHGVTDPGSNKPASCFVMLEVSYEGFTRRYPLPDADKEVYEAGNGMACPKDAEVTLTGDYGTGAKEK